ncbi:MAG: helical backbone metal receptor [Flavobacteriales bacterium]|nr:helical backbone metal receptor [Flavobacteriales bacterium]
MQFTDHIGHVIELPKAPTRIISLVPSQTELLFSLGLDHEVVGLTKFCIHPEEKWRSVTRVGGTKNVNHQRIAELAPDLIIANKEENTKEDILHLQDQYPVWTSDIENLEDAFHMIRDVGELVGKAQEASTIADDIAASLQSIKGRCRGKVAYLIWENPKMLAGPKTFIHEMLNFCGWENAVDQERYPELTIEQLQDLQPDLIMLSSEPYPFKQKHLDEFMQLFPNSTVSLVDGEMFSWYGSRMMLTADYIRKEFLVD